MAKFKKCPRCDINYILAEQDYCEICIAEMKGQKFIDEDDQEAELCPKCKQNYLNEGEKICISCAAEAEKARNEADEFNWKAETEIEVDEEDIVIPDNVSLEALAEDESDWHDEEIEDEENIAHNDDDDYEPLNFDDDDYDEDYDDDDDDYDDEEEEEE